MLPPGGSICYLRFLGLPPGWLCLSEIALASNVFEMHTLHLIPGLNEFYGERSFAWAEVRPPPYDAWLNRFSHAGLNCLTEAVPRTFCSRAVPHILP